MNGDEARWADAHALLEEPPSEADLAGLRRRLRISWLIVGPLLIAALGVRVATAESAHARALIGAGFLVLVAILIIVGLVVSARSSVERSGDYPLSALARHQRRLLMREVQGRAPAEPAHLDLARYLAYRQSMPRSALPYSFAGIVLLLGRAWFAHPDAALALVLAVVTAFFLALLALGVVQSRRARRFLAAHPATDRPEDDE